MVINAERKERSISMRLPEADIAMIDRAAGLRGPSRTNFVRDAAVRAAEEALMESRLIRMVSEGFTDFMAILSGPATAIPEMSELAKRLAPWEAGYVGKGNALGEAALSSNTHEVRHEHERYSYPCLRRP